MGFFDDVVNAVSDAANSVANAVGSPPGWVQSAVNAVVGGVTTAVNFVVDTLDSTVGVVLDVIGFAAGIIFSIPYFGRFLQQLWNWYLTIFWFAFSFVDFILSLLGLMPEKRMKIRVIIQRDEAGNPIATSQEIFGSIQYAIDTFKSQANVRLLPLGPFQYSSAFRSPPTASDDYIVTDSTASGPDELDVKCEDNAAGLADLGFVGSFYQQLMNRDCFWGDGRSLLGYGAPVAAIAVRRFLDRDLGCSPGGPAVNYVLVDFSPADNVADPLHFSTLAHELGHACNLVHVTDENNLMIHQAPHPPQLNRGQVALLRASRHVTYF